MSLAVDDGGRSTTAITLLLGLDALRNGAHPLRQVRDVVVAALGAQLVEGPLEPPEVVPVEPAGALGAVDVLGEGADVLRARELGVVRRADVDERADRRRRRVTTISSTTAAVIGGGGRVEGRVVDGVAVDLADVEVGLDLGDAGARDAVGAAPDAGRGRMVRVAEGGPVGPVDEGYDAAWGRGGAAVVLAFLGPRKRRETGTLLSVFFLFFLRKGVEEGLRVQEGAGWGLEREKGGERCVRAGLFHTWILE